MSAGISLLLRRFADLSTRNLHCHWLSLTDSTANLVQVRILYYLFIHIFMHFTQMLTIKVALVEQVENVLKLVFSWSMKVYWFLSHIIYIYMENLIFLRPS